MLDRERASTSAFFVQPTVSRFEQPPIGTSTPEQRAANTPQFTGRDNDGYFKNGSAVIPDLSIFFIYSCAALDKSNGARPLLNGFGRYRVKFLPNKAAAAAEFGGAIVPPDAHQYCKVH
jgi:hypothetical protein